MGKHILLLVCKISHFSDPCRSVVTALDACCTCGGGSLKVGTAPHRGLQIFKGDSAHTWSVQGNSPFHVNWRNSQGDTVLQLKTTCVDVRCNHAQLTLSNAKARGAYEEICTISLDTFASLLELPRIRGDAREWDSDQGVIQARELLVTGNRSGFKVEFAPWKAENSYFYRSTAFGALDTGLLDVSSGVNPQQASITVISGGCHPSCDLCTHFGGQFTSTEQKATLCVSCPSGSSLDVVHPSIAAGICVPDSQLRLDSVENYAASSVRNYLKIFSTYYPECWSALTTRAAGAVVEDTNCSHDGTHLCDDSIGAGDATLAFQRYCSTYNVSGFYSATSRCTSREGDSKMTCFKCEPHLAQCRCGRWAANAGEVWQPYWRGSPSTRTYGALVTTKHTCSFHISGPPCCPPPSHQHTDKINNVGSLTHKNCTCTGPYSMPGRSKAYWRNCKHRATEVHSLQRRPVGMAIMDYSA